MRQPRHRRIALAFSELHRVDTLVGGAGLQAEQGWDGDGERDDHRHHDPNLAGLQAASIPVSHIRIGSCAARGGTKFALNPVIADDQGMADSKTTVQAIYPPTSGSWYVVVHVGPDVNGTNSQYLLCGNLFK